MNFSSERRSLTTPVYYMSTIPSDPFFSDLAEEQPDFFDTYDYYDNWSAVVFHGGTPGDGTRGFSWRMASSGLDGVMCWGALGCNKGGHTGIDYNLTNGVISDGDIVTVGGTVVNGDLVVTYPFR